MGVILTLALLAGGYWLYQRFLVEKPLADALHQLPEVMDWSLRKDKDKKVLIVELASVSNLKESSNAIKDTAEHFLGKEAVEIHLLDRRSSELEKVMYAVQFPLYEALVQGNFTHMAEFIRIEAENAKLSRYQIYIDESYLYIQLHQGQNYLYEIVPRTTEVQPALIVSNK